MTLELRICPGIRKLYRLALVGPGDTFETLSEHDTPANAVKAKREAEQAALSAFVDFGLVIE